MNTYEPGNLITISALFTDSLGVAADPTTVTLRVEDPAGVETDFTYAGGAVTRVSAGNYKYSLPVTEVGYWKYRWEGTGAVYAAKESRFKISQSSFDNPA